MPATLIKRDKSRYSHDKHEHSSRTFFKIQYLNAKKMLNKMANTANKELNKSRDLFNTQSI